MKMPELNKKNTTMLVGGLTLAFIMWLFFSCSSVEEPVVEAPAKTPVEEVTPAPVVEPSVPVIEAVVEEVKKATEEAVIKAVTEAIALPTVTPSDTTQISE
tara:strand:- start:226 stop:528 length:303 start_codon:yes stop_codon:yes gene_type:complete